MTIHVHGIPTDQMPSYSLSDDEMSVFELVALGVLSWPVEASVAAAAPVLTAMMQFGPDVGARRLLDPEGVELATIAGGELHVTQVPVHHDLTRWRRGPAPAGFSDVVWIRGYPSAMAFASMAERLSASGESGLLALLLPVPWNADLDSYDLAASFAWLRDFGGRGFQLTVVPFPRRLPTSEQDVLAEAIARRWGGRRLLMLPCATGTDPLPADLEAARRRRWSVRHPRGLVVLFSGLSGSGKSTLARALRARLLECGRTGVTLLDGDVVRKHLSRGLGFSREDRAANVLRIGYVATEVSRHGGVALCAPIAPHDDVRRQVRAMAGAVGDFLLVHVATPLYVCEARDRKGLYARARAGQVTAFTGVSDPFEAPEDAEISIDTSAMDVEEAMERITGHPLLRRRLGEDVT